MTATVGAGNRGGLAIAGGAGTNDGYLYDTSPDLLCKLDSVLQSRLPSSKLNFLIPNLYLNGGGELMPQRTEQIQSFCHQCNRPTLLTIT